MITYASNKDGNSIVVDAQEWEELHALVARQRIALDELLKAVHNYLNAVGTNREIDRMNDLREIYKQISSASTMTGASEK